MKKFIAGNHVNLRDVEVSDAEFVLLLRTDPKKSQFLNKTNTDVENQRSYIRRYKDRPSEWYFVIENKIDKRKLGTIRIYNVQGTCFESGSWLVCDDAPLTAAIESFILLHIYGFFVQCFSSEKLSVHKANRRVVKFQRQFGAVQIRETPMDYCFERAPKDFCRAALLFPSLIPPEYLDLVQQTAL